MQFTIYTHGNKNCAAGSKCMQKYCRIGNQSEVQINQICNFGFFLDIFFRKANIEGQYYNDRNNTSDFHYTELTPHGKVWQIKQLRLISYSTICTYGQEF